MSVTRRHRTDPTAAAPAPDGPRRPGVGRRLARGSLVVAAGTVALALAGPFALRPFVDVAHAAGTAGETSVAFVLDFGGSTSDQVVGCVTVPSSDDRYDALAAFVGQEHLAQPTFNASGLLCSINGIPASGCGTEVGDGYIYWAYWTGGPHGWTYSESGAQGAVGTDDVEGWRFENPGKANPSDPPPRTPARYGAICGSRGTTTTTSGGGGGKAGGNGDGGSPSAGTAATSPVGAAATGTPAATQRTHPKKGSPGATGQAGGAASSVSGSTSPTATTPSASPAPSTIPTAVPQDDVSAHDPGPGGSSPVPLVVGGLIVAALAIAAYVRSRRNPRTR